VTFIDGHVHNLYFNWTGTFPRQRRGGRRRRHRRQLDHAGHEHRADRGNPDDGGLGVTLKRLGWRTTMILGILGHAARFAVFAFFPAVPVAGHPDQRGARHRLRVLLRDGLHLRRRVLPEGRRASAQGLFNLMILGFGPLVANVIGRS
jgi:hypothetical protein